MGIQLNDSTESLTVLSDAVATTTEPTFHAVFTEITSTDTTQLSDINNNTGSLTGDTRLDLVAAPTGSNERDVFGIKIDNVDTVAHTIEIFHSTSSTHVRIYRCVLNANEKMTYADGEWTIYGATGKPQVDQAPEAHAATHILGGSDPIDADTLDVTFTPSNYTPTTTPPEATDLDHLTAHLGGIDSEIGTNASDISTHTSDTANPHATDIENLGSGTLAELNAAITDATLDDSGDPRDPNAHAADHVRAGADEIDGDILDIDFTPTNYTPDTTPGEVTNVDELSAHLAGIDNEIGTNASDISTHTSDTANPHATDIENLGSGTLAELNAAITDATLDDSGDARTPTAHAASHIKDGSDEIDGDQLDIDFTPTNYTPSTAPAEASDLDHLTAHLAGIDDELATVGTGAGASMGFRLSAGTSLTTILDDSASADLWLVPWGPQYGTILLEDTLSALTVVEGQAALQIDITGLTTDTNYDVFAWWTGTDGVVFELVAWATDTTRTTAIVVNDDLGYVKSGETYKRYLGSIRTISTSKTQDDDDNRFIWNYYNRISRRLYQPETTASWSSSGTAWRQANGNTANTVGCLVGVAEEDILLHGGLSFLGSGTAVMNAFTGIGANSTTVNTGEITGRHGHDGDGAGDQATSHVECHVIEKRLGYTAYNLLERIGAGSATIYGSASQFQGGGIWGNINC